MSRCTVEVQHLARVQRLIHAGLCRLLEVLDKGKAAAVTSITETKDKATGKVIFENQSTVFIRGAGGFGGKRTGKGASSALPFALPPFAAHKGAPEVADATLFPRSRCGVGSEHAAATQAGCYP